MKQKIFAIGLSAMLLFVQNSFIFAQTSAARTTDELVNLLDEPDAVAVVNVKKILSDIAPTLLNKDTALLAKLAAAMKSVEDETGVNPYSLDKIVIGTKIDKPDENFLVIFQNDSSEKLAASIFQNQLDTAKLNNEINPLKEKIFAVQNRITVENLGGGDDDVISTINAGLDKQLTDASALETALDALTRTRMNQALIDQTLTDTTKIRTELEAINKDFKARTVPNDFKSRIETLDKQAKNISLRDTNRAAKIAEIEKPLMMLDRESADFYYKLGELKTTVNDHVDALTRASILEKVKTSVETLPTSEAARTLKYRQMRKQLAEMQRSVTLLATDMKSENLPTAPPTVPLKTDMNIEAQVYPTSTVVTRQDENTGGKKMVVIKTVKKYGGDREDVVTSQAMLLVDDKTLMLGESKTLTDALAKQSAERNKTARELIAKSGDALVAFGVDLKSVDLKELAELFGEQKTAWQIYGSLSSTGNDLSLEAIVEKTDRPLVLAAKPNTDEKTKPAELPIVGDNDVVTDMLDLTVKSIVGIEGKFTVRFEKKKVVAMLEETPTLLQKWRDK